MNRRFRMPGFDSGHRSVRIAQYFFLLVGVLALGYCVYVVGKAHLYQTYESWRLDQARQHRPASTGEFMMSEIANLWSRLTGESASRFSRRRAGPPAEGSLLGRVDIPRLGLSSVVLEGDDERVLQVAVGHIPGTALPGQGGNVALAGHRDTFFRELRDVRSGDRIELTTPEGDYHYRVESAEVVPPGNVAVLKPTAQASLTLVTCYPFNYVGSAPDRFVVRAQRVTSDQALASLTGGVHHADPSALVLPAALPGETGRSQQRPRLERRLAKRHRTRSRENRAELDEGLDGQDARGMSRPQRTRALASRLRSEWDRLFAHLKGSSSESP